MELEVDIININYDKNIDMINKSKTFNEYRYFIHLVRENIKNDKDKIEKAERIWKEEAFQDGIELEII